MKKKIAALICAASILLLNGCSAFAPFTFDLPKWFDDSSSDDGTSYGGFNTPTSPSGGAAMALDENGTLTINRVNDKDAAMGDNGTWTFFVYMCGSDLESESGFGTRDINEMLASSANANVKFVIQTGGSSAWKNPDIDPKKLQRYVVRDGSMQLAYESPLAAMSDRKTFEDFVSWGVENYPAEKMGLIIWDHGGGSIAGTCVDEFFPRDTLTLMEMNGALAAASAKMTDKFEFIGFDACLMGTIETANICANYARYMIASQENEPGFGWDYKEIADYAVREPSITGAQLGQRICENYYRVCRREKGLTDMTLSVCDLSKLDDLMIKLNTFSHNLYDATEDSAALAQFSRNARRADNFGGNNVVEGYSNMVDLRGLVKAGADIADGAQAVLSALNDTVTYSVHGTAHSDAGGLSIFYPLSTYKGSSELSVFADVAVSPYYLAFVTRSAYGAVNDGSTASYNSDKLFDLWGSFWEYIGTNANNFWNNISDWNSWDYWDDYDYDNAGGGNESSLITFEKEPFIDDEGVFGFVLTDDALKYTERVEACIYMLTNGEPTLLGYTSDLYYDWTSGYICDNFTGSWFCLPDGQLLSVQPVSTGDDYDVYTAPVLLNGKATNLRFTDDYKNDRITIDGVWDGIDENGLSSRVVEKLKSGDRIQPCYSVLSQNSGDYDKAGGVYVYDGSSTLKYSALPDADYEYCFIIYDVFGNYRITDFALFYIEDGEIYYDDELL